MQDYKFTCLVVKFGFSLTRGVRISGEYVWNWDKVIGGWRGSHTKVHNLYSLPNSRVIK